jgi:hypothetical protein
MTAKGVGLRNNIPLQHYRDGTPIPPNLVYHGDSCDMEVCHDADACERCRHFTRMQGHLDIFTET